MNVYLYSENTVKIGDFSEAISGFKGIKVDQ